jgi:Mn2+/Fe2+ NRAMP family transporter
MIPMAVALAIADEIAVRTGVVTGKGLSEMIREEYGLRITSILMAALVLCNLGDIVSEFVGVASSLQLFGISKFISVLVTEF